MNSLQKFGSVASGGLMLITGLILVFMPDDGTFYVALILAITLFLIGMRLLIYYFTMARRMVGGRSVLLLGIFLLDFCAFTVTILDEPRVIVILYLVGWHGFSGLVSLLRAREAKLHKGNWKFKAANGVVNILVVIGCICFVKNPAMLTLIYSVGLYLRVQTDADRIYPVIRAAHPVGIRKVQRDIMTLFKKSRPGFSGTALFFVFTCLIAYITWGRTSDRCI